MLWVCDRELEDPPQTRVAHPVAALELSRLVAWDIVRETGETFDAANLLGFSMGTWLVGSQFHGRSFLDGRCEHVDKDRAPGVLSRCIMGLLRILYTARGMGLFQGRAWVRTSAG